jgi:hypothetical protein
LCLAPPLRCLSKAAANIAVVAEEVAVETTEAGAVVEEEEEEAVVAEADVEAEAVIMAVMVEMEEAAEEGVMIRRQINLRPSPLRPTSRVVTTIATRMKPVLKVLARIPR